MKVILQLSLLIMLGFAAGSLGTRYILIDELTQVSKAQSQYLVMYGQRELVQSCRAFGVYFVADVAQKRGVLINCQFLETQTVDPSQFDNVIKELAELVNTKQAKEIL